MGIVTAVSTTIGTQTEVVERGMVEAMKTQPSQGENYITSRKEVEPKDYLRELAGKDFDLFDRIIYCESGWKPNAQNPTSSAGGLFQFINSTWVRYSSPSWEKYDPFNNIKAGVSLYKKEGTKPWEASKNCWKRLDLSTKVLKTLIK